MATPPLDRALLSLEGLSLGEALGESFFPSDAPKRIQSRRLSEAPWRLTDEAAMAVGGRPPSWFCPKQPGVVPYGHSGQPLDYLLPGLDETEVMRGVSGPRRSGPCWSDRR